MKKILSVIANALLILLPFYPVTENFLIRVDNRNFFSYILICICLSALMLLLMLFIGSNFLKHQYGLKPTALLLFILGMIVMIPLHLGPPREGETLLEAKNIERFRYSLLIVAVIVLYAAVYLFLKTHWQYLKISGKLIVVPLLIGLPILLWDNYDSFSFSSQITGWMKSGKNAKDFFPQYEFHDHWRAVGRIQLYIIAAWLGMLLSAKSFISKWAGIVIAIFSVTGIGFCVAFLIKGPAFYFPFMVPAIAMAPAYWLGVALLNNARIKISAVNLS